jgi:hypothetical protein
MSLSKKLSAIIIPLVTGLILVAYFYYNQINDAMKSDSAGNILLVVLIIIDGVGGVLVPFLLTGSIDKKGNVKGLRIYR